jgi:hypothetical protein
MWGIICITYLKKNQLFVQQSKEVGTFNGGKKKQRDQQYSNILEKGKEMSRI